MKALVLCLLIFGAIGCRPSPKAIEYGHEACEYCLMTIVDQRYAAQLVSSKNKASSFDAAECMIHYKKDNDGEFTLELVTDYNKPGHLIPAEGAYIVRSEQLPSPMGMYLTAVANKQEAEELQNRHGGEIYRYSEVATELDKLPRL